MTNIVLSRAILSYRLQPSIIPSMTNPITQERLIEIVCVIFVVFYSTKERKTDKQQDHYSTY